MNIHQVVLYQKGEKDQLDYQVLRNPNAYAHQLRTGNLIPGSVPLSSITPSLGQPLAARYCVGQSRSRLGLPSSSPLTEITFIAAMEDMNNKQEFLIELQSHRPAYIVMQTTFMQNMVDEVAASGHDNPADGQHGFVVNGDHSYSPVGQLLVACGFSRTLNAWAPLAYSWIKGVTAEHHWPFFRHFFKGIQEAAGVDFDHKMLTTVSGYTHNLLVFLLITLNLFLALLGHGLFLGSD